MATVSEPPIPPLGPGDRLSREEFLRRWEAHPEVKKAELIGGIVYMPSPVTVEHGDSAGHVGGWLQVYSAYTPGTASGHNTTSFLLDDTPQPDLNLRLLPEYGGHSRVEGKYLHGVPELLAEICRSSVAYDLHVKFDLYQAAGVPEYMAVLLHEKEIRWHVLADGAYHPCSPIPTASGVPECFPGCGSTARHCSRATWPECWACCSKDSPVRST